MTERSPGRAPDQNNVTLDGLDVNDMATGQFGIVTANAPVDSVQELRAVTANPLASEGQGGGGQFTMVTKGGSNNFHGALFEYHRDTTTEANDWFNNNAGVPRAPLIRNQFGGNIGRPDPQEQAILLRRVQRPARQPGHPGIQSRCPSMSSATAISNTFSSRMLGGNTCIGTSRANTTPQCIGMIDSAQVAQLDPQKIGFDPALLDFINKRYPHANDLTGGDGINTGGYRFNAPVILKENDYVARVSITP